MDIENEPAGGPTLDIPAKPAKKAKKTKAKVKKAKAKKAAKTKKPAPKKPAKKASKPVKRAGTARTERLDLRLTKPEKAKLNARAKVTRRTITSLIIELIEKMK